jgi:hypothetical protein
MQNSKMEDFKDKCKLGVVCSLLALGFGVATYDDKRNYGDEVVEEMVDNIGSIAVGGAGVVGLVASFGLLGIARSVEGDRRRQSAPRPRAAARR